MSQLIKSLIIKYKDNPSLVHELSEILHRGIVV
jgi:hypothetical protein